MNLYHVEFDNESYWVEAESLAEAVRIFREVWARDDSLPYSDTEEPDSVHKVSDKPVLRAKEVER